MYAVKYFVVTRVTEQAMIVVSDTLSDCISLIKFFDNYAREVGCYIVVSEQVGPSDHVV